MITNKINEFTASLQEPSSIEDCEAYGINADGESVKIPIEKISTAVSSSEKILMKTSDGLTTEIKLDYDSSTQLISLKGIDDVVISQIDASKFVSGGLLESASIEVEDGITYLVMNFSTTSGTQTIKINVTDLVDVYNGSNLNLSSSYEVPSTYSAPTSGMNVDKAVGNIISKLTSDAARISALEKGSVTTKKLYLHVLDFQIAGPTAYITAYWIGSRSDDFAKVKTYGGASALYSITKGVKISAFLNRSSSYWSNVVGLSFSSTGFTIYGTYHVSSRETQQNYTFTGLSNIINLTDAVSEIGNIVSVSSGMQQVSVLDNSAEIGTIVQYTGISSSSTTHGFFYEKTDEETWAQLNVDDLSSKLDKTNPTGTGSLTLGRHPSGDASTYVARFGNGTSDDDTSNAMQCDYNGNFKVSGDITDGEGNVLSKKIDAYSMTETEESSFDWDSAPDGWYAITED